MLYEYANQNDLSTEIIVEKEALRPILNIDQKRLEELVTKGHLEVLAVKEPLYYALGMVNSAKHVAPARLSVKTVGSADI